jgi:hypothetical protein
MDLASILFIVSSHFNGCGRQSRVRLRLGSDFCNDGNRQHRQRATTPDNEPPIVGLVN